ncbi:hypothetical protein CO675_00325 [Bradyrhizobium sp. C9]|nr:hypothetical protein CO675_00325 [Bradyrhizobium sp. C9]
MSESLPVLVERSIQIAWDLLERSGEITDPGDESRFFSEISMTLVRAGEHRQLMLANNAIVSHCVV